MWLTSSVRGRGPEEGGEVGRGPEGPASNPRLGRLPGPACRRLCGSSESSGGRRGVTTAPTSGPGQREAPDAGNLAASREWGSRLSTPLPCALQPPVSRWRMAPLPSVVLGPCHPRECIKFSVRVPSPFFGEAGSGLLTPPG